MYGGRIRESSMLLTLLLMTEGRAITTVSECSRQFSMHPWRAFMVSRLVKLSLSKADGVLNEISVFCAWFWTTEYDKTGFPFKVSASHKSSVTLIRFFSGRYNWSASAGTEIRHLSVNNWRSATESLTLSWLKTLSCWSCNLNCLDGVINCSTFLYFIFLFTRF